MVDHDKGFILIIKDRLPTVEAFSVLPFPDRLVFSGYLLDPVELPLFRVVIPFDIRVYVVAGAFDRSQEGIRKVDNYANSIFMRTKIEGSQYNTDFLRLKVRINV